MTQTEKNIEVLISFFKENEIDFKENIKVGKVRMDIYVPEMRIAIHYGDSQKFFEKTRNYYAPFFVRETESCEKTLEKIQNCVITQMTRLHNKLLRDKER